MFPTEIVLSLASFAALELAARGFVRARRRFHVWPPHARSLMILDRAALTFLPAVVRTEINADGERGDELPRDWSATWRVLVAGGSSAECHFVDQASSWPGVAQHFLNRRENLRLLGARRVHVGNVGRSLATARHMALMLRRILPRVERLDAVVLMVGTSDVARWLADGAPAEIGDADASEAFAEHPEAEFGWSPARHALRRVIAAWRRRHVRPIDVIGNAGSSLASARRMRAEAARIRDDLPDPAPMLERFERDLREVIGLARARARTVVVVRPSWLEKALTEEERSRLWMFGEGQPFRGEVRAYWSHRVAWRLLALVDERTAAVAREMNVAEVDPKLILEPGLAHFYDDTHHTPAGCRILGEAVAQAILRERRGRWTSRAPALREKRHADVA